MQSHITDLAQAVRQCTVSVQCGSAHGSGVIVSEEGYVLDGSPRRRPPDRRVRVILNDGRTVLGKSLGMHLELDAGLIKLDDDGPWPYLKMSRSPRVDAGQWCAAAGHPGGYDFERGPVFRLGRVLTPLVDGELIRTDCQLVGGDSGGPLVDMRGQVIGIHSRIGVSLANNLHVPISTYRENWQGLVDGRLWQSRALYRSPRRSRIRVSPCGLRA